jgi:hypothetical protein
VRRPNAGFLIKVLVVGALVALFFAKFDLREIASYLAWDNLVAALALTPRSGRARVRVGPPRDACGPAPALSRHRSGTHPLLQGKRGSSGRDLELLKATYLRDHAGWLWDRVLRRCSSSVSSIC